MSDDAVPTSTTTPILKVSDVPVADPQTLGAASAVAAIPTEPVGSSTPDSDPPAPSFSNAASAVMTMTSPTASVTANDQFQKDPPASLPVTSSSVYAPAATPVTSPTTLPKHPVDVLPTSDIRDTIDTPDTPTPSSTPSTPSNPGDQPEKSPLEILEEILAGAEAEKKQKDEEAAQKKAQEEAEAAAKAAAEAAYQEEVARKVELEKVKLAEAKTTREQVEQQLIEQGKVDPSAGQGYDQLAIRQLEHRDPAE